MHDGVCNYVHYKFTICIHPNFYSLLVSFFELQSLTEYVVWRFELFKLFGNGELYANRWGIMLRVSTNLKLILFW